MNSGDERPDFSTLHINDGECYTARLFELIINFSFRIERVRVILIQAERYGLVWWVFRAHYCKIEVTNK